MERDSFRQVVMPAAYVTGIFGLLGLAGSLVYSASTDHAVPEAMGLSLALVLMPLSLMFYRVVRGHFSAALNEP